METFTITQHSRVLLRIRDN